MKKRFRIIYFALLALVFANPVRAAYVMENLNRGVVSVRVGGNNFVSWRWLGTEADNVSFNVYRNGAKVNGAAIADRTNYTDNGAPANATYTIRPVVGAVEQGDSETAGTWAQQYLSVPIQRPAGGTNLDGVAYTYQANDCSVGDLDGDGDYEIIVKWYPSDAQDNCCAGQTSKTYLDAYRMDGTRLWRIDLGINIRSGAHYTQFMVYDFDGDGKSELMVKTAPGTRDGLGNYLSLGPAASDNDAADYRSGNGYVLAGPEHLTVFNGETGAEMATVQYQPQRRPGADDITGAQMCTYWGDTYGNRMDRFLAGVAYLDGNLPSGVFARGYYPNQNSCGGSGRTVIWAVDWRGGVLSTRWTFDTRNAGMAQYIGKGNHQLSIADVDSDGRQEIIYGALTLEDNGTPKYAATWGHADALHVADIDPSSPGLEIWDPDEWSSNVAVNGRPGAALRRASDGVVLWSKLPGSDGADIGRAMSADLSAAWPGMESWASGGLGLYSAQGAQIGNVPNSINFAVWWDGDFLRELLDREMVDKWNVATNSANRLLTAYTFGADANNGTKENPGLSGDILGDWREEIIFRNSNNESELLIFTTTTPSNYRIRTLVHDPQYRVAIAWQNTAYNQPPHTSFFLGDGMTPPSMPDITLAGGSPPTPGPSSTRTRTATATYTPTPLPTATLTFTRTATRTATLVPPSATHTPTVTHTHSPTRTVSPPDTATLTFSPTLSSTQATSPTLSATGTPSTTSTETPLLPSATATETTVAATVTSTETILVPTATESETMVAATPTQTIQVFSATVTSTATETILPVTATETQVLPTATATETSGLASVTPAFSATATAGETALAPTETFTSVPASSTATLTSTPPPTSSATLTSTFAPTATQTMPAPTQTVTPIQTVPSLTASQTMTATLTSTATWVSTLVPTLSFTPDTAPVITGLDVVFGPVVGGTVLRISGWNFEDGAVVMLDGQPPAGVTWIDGMTIEVVTAGQDAGWVDLQVTNPSGQSAVHANAFEYRLPGEADGTLEISQALMAPNPVTGSQASLSFFLKGQADRLKWKLYSTALALLRQGEVDQVYRPGWNTMPLDLDGVPNGTWYLMVEAERGQGAKSEKKIVRCMILR